MDSFIDRVTDFFIEHYPDTDREVIRYYIEEHYRYDTLIVLRDDTGKVIAIARWNIPSPDTARILDVIVRDDFRKGELLRVMIAMGAKRFPTVKYLQWERERKYPGRPLKTYRIEKLLQGVLKDGYDQD